jgi:hypothetical protein
MKQEASSSLECRAHALVLVCTPLTCSNVGRRVFSFIHRQNEHYHRPVIDFVDQSISLFAEFDFVTVSQVPTERRPWHPRLQEAFLKQLSQKFSNAAVQRFPLFERLWKKLKFVRVLLCQRITPPETALEVLKVDVYCFLAMLESLFGENTQFVVFEQFGFAREQLWCQGVGLRLVAIGNHHQPSFRLQERERWVFLMLGNALGARDADFLHNCYCDRNLVFSSRPCSTLPSARPAC